MWFCHETRNNVVTEYENEVVVVSPEHKEVALRVQTSLWPFEFIPAGRASVSIRMN